MAVQLELPVGPGGEPVVVIAIQDDRRVGTDPRLGKQRAEVLAAGDVAADPIGQLARPVPADGAWEVALLVCGRVHVDLDEADVRVVQVFERPIAVDEGVLVGVRVVTHGLRSSSSSTRSSHVARALVTCSGSRLPVSRPTPVGRGG